MKIPRDEAEAFFAAPIIRRAAKLNGPLPDFAEYYADGGLCLAAHPLGWPGVVMIHLGAKPEAWGHLDGPARRLLSEIAEDQRAGRIVAWIPDAYRAAQAMATRAGMQIDGRLPLLDPVTCFGWSETCPSA